MNGCKITINSHYQISPSSAKLKYVVVMTIKHTMSLISILSYMPIVKGSENEPFVISAVSLVNSNLA